VTLSDFTFQLDSGPILNDDSASVPFVDIDKVVGLDSAPYRETIRDHEGTDGGFIDAEFERGRDVILEGMIYLDSNNDETYLDELKANFAPRTAPVSLVLKPPGVDERVIFVKPRGVRYDWESVRRVGMTPAQFLMYAEDPRIYDNSLLSTLIPFGGLATTGFGFSFGFDLSFGVTVPPAGANVVNAGNRPMPAVMTVAGPVVNPRIINQTDSRTLEFEVDVPAASSLVIDLVNRTVVLDGTNARGFLTTAEWWLFNPGTTMILFGGASGSGSLTIEYRNAWR
jgi:hypothetical protein